MYRLTKGLYRSKASFPAVSLYTSWSSVFRTYSSNHDEYVDHEYNYYLKYPIDTKNNPTPTLNPSQLNDRISKIPMENYRSFVIAAHIDHGKSTISDRLLELTGVLQPGSNKQVLDKLDVERERGITVKAQTCSMVYHYEGEDYLLNLVDSPGHVDFRLEVSRSYAACGGALLLVDASEGCKAQTVANYQMAKSMGLELLPVINKIDLDTANIERTEDQIEETFDLPRENVIHVSAKSGLNVQYVLPAVIEHIPAPQGNKTAPFKALLVDSWYDSYIGVVLLVSVVDGTLKKGQKIQSCSTLRKYDVKEVGVMYPDRFAIDVLSAGQVGYIVPGMKNSAEALVGDTFHVSGKPVEALPGFEEPKSMVFVGAFPADGGEFKRMEESLEHLVTNDRSVTLQRETSNALGQGWRLGFLGSLHASVFKERLENEYGAKLIITSPTVPYKVVYRDGTEKIVTNPDDFPGINDKNKVAALYEPFVEITMTFPNEYLGTVMKLCEANRAMQLDIQYLNNGQVLAMYDLPLAHLVDDFFGKLKSATKGYASLDYEDSGYQPSDIVKLELLVNGNGIDALATVMHKSQVERNGQEFVKRFKEFLKIQQFDVIIQARANSKIVARETIKARRKDVLAKLHASDVSRRKKLLVRQKEGKKQLKSIGNIQINNDAYQSFLRRS
ncbi:Translation factor guf1 mitochondrial [Komagataella kurtzmanii]|nr:Translation factor guf1 mitochondrial [Komagataella kurtzmanii]